MTLLGRLLPGAALAFVPTAALACSCDDPRQFTSAQVEKAALHLVEGGYIIAEVERIDRGAAFEPQRFTVRKTLLGQPLASTVTLAAKAAPGPDGRPLPMIVTSCDYDLQPGYKGLAIFATRSPRSASAPCMFGQAGQSAPLRLAGLCTFGLLENKAILQRALALARSQAGVRRSRRPPSSSR